jgi:hypothetical protein
MCFAGCEGSLRTLLLLDGQHYAQITPTTLTKAYADAGYFDRNLRTIAVLVDRAAVTSGAAAAGEPWQF